MHARPIRVDARTILDGKETRKKWIVVSERGWKYR